MTCINHNHSCPSHTSISRIMLGHPTVAKDKNFLCSTKVKVCVFVCLSHTLFGISLYISLENVSVHPVSINANSTTHLLFVKRAVGNSFAFCLFFPDTSCLWQRLRGVGALPQTDNRCSITVIRIFGQIKPSFMFLTVHNYKWEHVSGLVLFTQYHFPSKHKLSLIFLQSENYFHWFWGSDKKFPHWSC